MKGTARVTILAVGLGVACVLTVSAEDREASLASVQVLAIRKATELADLESGSVVYVSVGRGSKDPSAALLAALADGIHVFKPHSSCPHRRASGFGEFCLPEAGAVEVFVGEVTFLGEDLAEANLGYWLGPGRGPSCRHRFKREAGKWSLVPENEFREPCRIH